MFPPPASSPPVAAMERSKVTCFIQVSERDVALSRKMSVDFSGLGGPALERPFSSSYLMLLLHTENLLTIWDFFFLHCRASARHGRSTTGILSRIEIKFPWKQETNKEHKQNTNKQYPHTSQGTRQSNSAREIRKLSETR